MNNYKKYIQKINTAKLYNLCNLIFDFLNKKFMIVSNSVLLYLHTTNGQPNK